MQQQQVDRCTVIEGWCVAHQRKAGHLEAADRHIEALRQAAQVFLIEGRCLSCDGAVSRPLDEEGPYASLGPWRHDAPGMDTQHPVINVLPPSGVV